MEIRVLGPIEAAEGTRMVDIRGPRARALLALLVLRANQPVWVERLAEDLWQEGPPPSAASTLKGHLSRLRTALSLVTPDAGQLIRTGNGTYELCIDPQLVDASRFEAMADRGRDHLAEGRFADARGELDPALGLWRGDPYPELDGSPTAEAEVTRLRELRRVAEDDLIDARLGLGDDLGAVADLERLVAAEPMRERRVGQLMRALYASGRQVDALRTFDRFRRTLVEEMGLDPGPRLRQLEEAILLQRPDLLDRPDDGPPPALRIATGAPPTGVPDLPPPLAQSSLSPLFGRAAELAVAHLALDRTALGGSVVLAVEGEAGIGKSRLVAELWHTAAADPSAAFFYGRSDHDLSMPYHPVVRAIDQALGRLDEAQLREVGDSVGSALGGLLPAIDGHVHRDQPALIEPETDRYRLFEAFRRAFDLLGGERPVVLVIDDAHDADRETIRLLRYIAGQGGRSGTGVAVVVAYRGREVDDDHPLTDLLVDADRAGRLERLALGGLDDDHASALVDHHAGGDVAPTSIGRVVANGGGNPLFLEELVRQLVAGSSPEALPPRLTSTIGRRIGMLSAGCRTVLELAAVIGREQSLDLIVATTPLDEARTLDALEEAISAEVLAEVSGEVGSFVMAHPLFGEVLLGTLSATKRARLHRAVLDALTAAETGTAADLARHALGAGPLVPPLVVAGLARQAGDEAFAVAGFDEAADHYERGLEVLPTDAASSVTRTELLLAVGTARAASSEDERSGQAFRAAAASAREAGRSDLLTSAALGFRTTYAGGLYGFGGVGAADAELVSLLDEALAGVDPASVGDRSMLLSRLAQARYWDAPAVERTAWATEAVTLAERGGDERALGLALIARRFATWSAGGGRDRITDDHRLLALGQSIGALDLQMEALGWLIFDLLEVADRGGLTEVVELHQRMTEQLQRPAYHGYAELVRAMLALLHGVYPEALARSNRAQEIFAGTGLQLAGALCGSQLLLHHWDTGALGALGADIEMIASEVSGLPAVEAGLAFVAAETAQLDTARQLLDRLAADDFAAFDADVSWSAAAAMLTIPIHRLGDAALASTLGAQLAPIAGTFILVGPPAAATLGPADLYLGLLADCRDARDEAVHHLERAAHLAESMAARPAVARSLASLAVVLARGGVNERRRSGAVRSRAEQIAGEIGMVLPSAPR